MIIFKYFLGKKYHLSIVLYSMEQIKFEHRYRYQLEARLQSARTRLQMNRSEYASAAILLARKLWRKGKWHPQRKSPFLTRENAQNKITVWMRFSPEVYLYLKKMARAMDVSLAEMLRLALDVMCSYVLRDGPGIVAEVVSRHPKKTVRIRGINVLDHIDHRHECVGGVLDFEICNIRDIKKNNSSVNHPVPI